MTDPIAPIAVLLAPAYDHGEYLAAESLGLRSVAAVLHKAGAQVHVFDECLNPPPEHIVALARQATFVGIGVLFTRQTPDAIELARSLRSQAPGAYFMIGGQGLQFLWEDVLTDCREIDSACLYEGEETILEVWARLLANADHTDIKGLVTREADGSIKTAGPRPPSVTLDDLPFAYRDPSSNSYRGGHATMSTSRGCAAHCTFCQSGNYANRYHKMPKWRHRGARSVVDEITHLHETYGVDMISFVDDDFLGGKGQGRGRAEDFIRLVRELPFGITFSIECRVDEVDREILTALRKVGLRNVLIGIESAIEADIQLFAKKTTNQQVEAAIDLLRDLNIDFSTGFITFHPTSNLEGIAENLTFLARNRITNYRRLTNRLELYPGSPLLRYYERRGVAMYVDRYRVYYEFADPRIATLYHAMRDLLADYQELESACAIEKFRASRGGDPRAFERLAELLRLSDSVSSSMIENARKCLAKVQSSGNDASFDEVRASVGEERSRLTSVLQRTVLAQAPTV